MTGLPETVSMMGMTLQRHDGGQYVASEPGTPPVMADVCPAATSGQAWRACLRVGLPDGTWVVVASPALSSPDHAARHTDARARALLAGLGRLPA